MNTIHEQNQALIQELGDFSQEFRSYAKSVKDLFFYYIQNSLHQKEDIYIDESDVYRIKEIIDLFESLKYMPKKDIAIKNKL